MRLFNRYYSGYDLALPLGDVAITLISVLAARLFVVDVVHYSEVLRWHHWTLLAGWVSVSVLVSFYYADLYEIDQALSQRELSLRFANGFGITCLLIAALSYPFPSLASRKFI